MFVPDVFRIAVPSDFEFASAYDITSYEITLDHVDNNCRYTTMHPSQARPHLHHTILVAITLQLSLLLPTLLRLIRRYYMKEPYHTLILSGYAWLQELLHGHPERICTKLGVHKEVFHALIRELQSMGHGDTRYVTLDEQLAIFLYTSVTGLSICHVRE
jgi:hypothetical protein